MFNNKFWSLNFLTVALAVIATTAYLGAPKVFAHDEPSLKPHHIDVPMNPTAVMRAFQASKAGQIEVVARPLRQHSQHAPTVQPAVIPVLMLTCRRSCHARISALQRRMTN